MKTQKSKAAISELIIFYFVVVFSEVFFCEIVLVSELRPLGVDVALVRNIVGKKLPSKLTNRTIKLILITFLWHQAERIFLHIKKESSKLVGVMSSYTSISTYVT